MSSSAWSDFGVGLLISAVVGTAGIIYGAHVAQAREYLNPQCTDAKGLKPIARPLVTAAGPGTKNYEATRAIDGFGGSGWIPPTVKTNSVTSQHVPAFSPDAERSTLTLSLAEPHDIRLVCVNNGLGNGDERYENWGKVRTVLIWSDDGEGSKSASLQSLPAAESDIQQEIGSDLGEVTTVNIQLLDAYAGKEAISHDPDRCARVRRPGEYYRTIDGTQEVFERGCILAPTARAGLSEVTLYEPDPEDQPPFPWFLFT